MAPTGDLHTCVRSPTFEVERICSNRLYAVCAASNPAWRQGERDVRSALAEATSALSLRANVGPDNAGNASTATMIVGTNALDRLLRLRFIFSPRRSVAQGNRDQCCRGLRRSVETNLHGTGLPPRRLG